MTRKEPIVWLAGSLLPASEARVSPFDRGFTVGCAAFETLRAHGGIPFALTRHWRRLVNSCKIMCVQPPLRDEFSNMMLQTLKANGLCEARVRFTVSAGESVSLTGTSGSSVVVHAVPFQPYAATEKVATMPWPRNERSPLSSVKCSSYAENILALQQAHARGASEAVFGNTLGDLCEGATSNVFVVQDGRTITPPLTSGCLGGVTRELVLEIGRANGIDIEERDVPLRDLSCADEAFLTSSTRGVQPIAEVDGIKLPHAPGPAGRKIARLYQELVSTNHDP